MRNLVKKTLKVAAIVAGAWAIKEYEIDKKIKSKWAEIMDIHSSKLQAETSGVDEEE